MSERTPCRTLAEVTSILTGFPFPSEQFAETGQFRLVRGSNVKRSVIDWTPEITRYWSEPDAALDKYQLHVGDVVIAMDGALVGRSYAKLTADDLPALLVQRVARLRCEALLDAEYVFQHVQSPAFRREMEAVKTNTAIPHISPGDIAGFSIWWPAPAVRHRIAAILSTWDRAIELTAKLIAAKQQRKDALMQRLLTGKVRLPGFRDTHWKACELGDVASNSARRIGTSTPPPVYSVTNSVGMVPMDESVVGESIDRYKAVAKHDFAYNPMRINVGSIAMWHGDGEVLVSPDYVVFRCGPDLDPEFLNHYRTSHQWDQFVTKAGGGSVRVRIYFSDLAELPLKLPSVEEQKAIAAVLNTQDREIELLQKKLDALRRQKKGLMQQLLTGRVRVRVESDSN